MNMYRHFTDTEQAARDGYTSAHVENDCAGCEDDGDYGWTPAQDCPVHGENCEAWWIALNLRLDERWPGEWRNREAAIADAFTPPDPFSRKV